MAVAVKMLHLWAATCQDVSSLGRWSHFLWFSGVPFNTCQFTNGCKFSYFILGLSMAVAVKMFHLWAATCQDVSSLGRWSHCLWLMPYTLILCISLYDQP